MRHAPLFIYFYYYSFRAVAATAEWLSDARTQLLPKFDHHQLRSIVNTIESIYAMGVVHGPNKHKFTKRRPNEVQVWIKSGRCTRQWSPHQSALGDFPMRWWAWWDELQPRWRRRDDQGRLVRETYAETGTWDLLEKPAASTYFDIVYSLWFWGTRSDVISKDFEAALEDVFYTFEGMLYHRCIF